jgi:TPR repeat protein
VRVAFPLQLVLAAALLAQAPASATAEAGSHGRSATECDRLAAHPSDPDKVTQGVPTAEVRGWNDAAIWACRQAVARSPDDPRQRYQLGRALFYAGRQAEALEHLEVAASSAHRQAQFVLGLMYTDGVPDVLEVDACRALGLWQDAASRGHFAARVALGRDWVRGRYKACVHAPSAEAVDGWLEAARMESTDYYQRLLIDWTRESLATGR